MRIPTRIQEHPVEAVIAGLLLLAVLAGSTDFKSARQPETPSSSPTQKL